MLLYGNKSKFSLLGITRSKLEQTTNAIENVKSKGIYLIIVCSI